MIRYDQKLKERGNFKDKMKLPFFFCMTDHGINCIKSHGINSLTRCYKVIII